MVQPHGVLFIFIGHVFDPSLLGPSSCLCALGPPAASEVLPPAFKTLPTVSEAFSATSEALSDAPEAYSVAP